MSQALNEGMRQEMEQNERVLLMGEDVTRFGGVFGITEGLIDHFGPKRVLDMPISEAGFVGFGIGCAIRGFPAIVDIMNFDFAGLAVDQICNRAAKLRYMTGGQLSVPLVVRGPTTSRIGLAGQHSQSLEGLFLQAPGLVVVTPADAYDAKGLLKTAIRHPDPVVFIEHRLLYASKSVVPEEDYCVPFGEGNVVREGSDVTIIANSIGVSVAVAAARELARRGIEASIVDLRTIKPMDVDLIVTEVEKTGRMVVVTEGNIHGGVAAEVVSAIARSSALSTLKAPPVCIALPDVPVPYAEHLENEVLPQPERVVSETERLLGQSSN